MVLQIAASWLLAKELLVALMLLSLDSVPSTKDFSWTWLRRIKWSALLHYHRWPKDAPSQTRPLSSKRKIPKLTLPLWMPDSASTPSSLSKSMRTYWPSPGTLMKLLKSSRPSTGHWQAYGLLMYATQALSMNSTFYSGSSIRPAHCTTESGLRRFAKASLPRQSTRVSTVSTSTV